jgi:pimeloyl-ACP methyl ester carboxylesterase
MARLDGTGRPVQLAPGYRLTAPGLRGRAEARPGREPASRGGGTEQATPALDRALRATSVREVRLIDLDVQPVPVPRGAAPVRTASGMDGMVLEVPDLGPDVGQLVLAVDEAGVVTWNLPEDRSGLLEVPATRGVGGTKRFVIRRQVPSTPTDGARSRGLFGLVGRKVLKVLVYPVTDAVLGPVGERFAGRWEAKRRPYRVRRFGPDDYTRSDAPKVTADDWRGLTDGRLLLFLHGTFSTARSAFCSLPAATLAELHRAYGGRLLAFDHYTLSEDPAKNAAWLADQLPSDLELEVDVVCHSRGGLVARYLAGAGLDRLRVRRVVLVGAPNNGTALADPDHMTDLVDRLTSVLNLVPPGPLDAVSEVLEAIITAVKVLGHAALKGLPGLAAMAPGGAFLGQLNGRPPSHADYYGVGANYDPKDGLRELVRQATNLLLDRVFGEQPNDLIVPTVGMFQAGGFRVSDDRTLRIEPNLAISHSHYFGHPETSKKLLDWLRAP